MCVCVCVCVCMKYIPSYRFARNWLDVSVGMTVIRGHEHANLDGSVGHFFFRSLKDNRPIIDLEHIFS